ncbi:META domain-containing protein [uncultured Microbulbifer sp.]|uniref:META domain-containing protein n=1 Tax=uncultured Microbulbifer sp. TaxID=348147 RepID=UPI0025CCCF97|nr:META domain-containing protein [uncultured Microbulbifer sp.]
MPLQRPPSTQRPIQCLIRRRLCGLLFLSLPLSACGHFAGDAEPANLQKASNADICEQQWLLESLVVDGREHKTRMFWQKMWRDRPYLTCDKLGFVRGSAGSNPYLGKFDLSDSGNIHWLKPPKISRMGERRESSELETDYLLALPRVDSASRQGDVLVLHGSDGTRVEFQRSSEAPPPAP